LSICKVAVFSLVLRKKYTVKNCYLVIFNNPPNGEEGKMEKKLKSVLLTALVISLAVVAACDDGIQPDADADCIEVGGGADFAGGRPCPPDGDGDADADNDGDEELCPSILIDSVPQNAEVMVNGIPSGSFTPATLPLPRGQEVVLSFDLNDYDESPDTLIVTEDCSSPATPFVLYPLVEGEEGTLWLHNEFLGTEGEYPVAFILQEGTDLTGEIGGASVYGSITHEGLMVLVDRDTTLTGTRVSSSVLEGTWDSPRGDSGEWRIVWP